MRQPGIPVGTPGRLICGGAFRRKGNIMYKAAIFDLDGTLADTLDDLGQAMNGMLRHFGWPERSREELCQFINRGARIFVARSMPEGSWEDINDSSVTEALRVYNAEYDKCFNDLTSPYEGVPELLAELREKGVKLAVLSNKQDKFVKLITERLFPDTFDVVRGHGEFPEKPSPESALATAAEMGVVPEECIFVGDSDIDMKTAQNAGMLPVGVSWGYRPPEILLDAGATVIAENAVKIGEFFNK